ncbi:hypothetical protein KXQ82_09905 [Mucilaginibacter sp. HMF5004]|uniref:hypothetical protein n=1 Tax=Mucilaginibacter rivuli TaxID=2857527 RepID=UPI001C5F5BBB|nr:hypothetical protein [Mucilaginibacter rivuli]MBW4890032.1 hypothetical protein [Mucilaginibacter rivuli]
METPKLNDFLLLLEVFHLGLSKGIIQKDEVIQWADDIITNTDEPDYLFIEISLGNNANHLIEIINEYVTPSNDPICYRVLLALIYHRYPIFNFEEAEKVATTVGNLSSWNTLTSFENNTIYVFEDYVMYYLPNENQLQEELINFLSLYEAFTLENHEQWADINLQVLELLKAEEIKVNRVNESNRKKWTRKARKENLKQFAIKLTVFLIVGLFVIVLVFKDGGNGNFPTYYFLLIYFIARMGYSWWRRKAE